MTNMPQVSQTNGTVAETITHLEQEWNQAVKAGDTAKIAGLLSDILVDLDVDGTVNNKSAVLDWVKHSQWELCEISDIKVVVHGNSAIATGIWRGKGTVAGKPFEAHERWLDTWLKNGKWQCVAGAGAPLKA
jgi:ketosteroid isomerase-like protein